MHSSHFDTFAGFILFVFHSNLTAASTKTSGSILGMSLLLSFFEFGSVSVAPIDSLKVNAGEEEQLVAAPLQKLMNWNGHPSVQRVWTQVLQLLTMPWNCILRI